MRGCGCPYCVGHKVLPGFNCLTSQRTDLAREWSPKNSRSPNEVTVGSKHKATWVCGDGHEWVAAVYDRSSGKGCPYCAGQRVIPGETCLASQRPDLASEWSPKNDRSTSDVVVRSTYQAVWVCSKHGHEWGATVYSRAAGNGCPVCAGRKALPGFNCLASQRPDLAVEWSPKNDRGPEEITAGSGYKATWVCGCGHEWVSTVNNRTSSGNGCPVCSGRKVEPGFNDLSTTHPKLSKEWSPKNGSLTPETVSAGSNKRVWWLCGLCSYEWLAQPNNRVSGGTGCPGCCVVGTSKIEGELYRLLEKHFPDSKQGVRVVRWSIDVLLPEERVSVEYDGSYFHKDALEKDARKTLDLLNQGYRVVRVREQSKNYTLPPLDTDDPHYLELTYDYSPDWSGLSDVVDQITEWVSSK